MEEALKPDLKKGISRGSRKHSQQSSCVKDEDAVKHSSNRQKLKPYRRLEDKSEEQILEEQGEKRTDDGKAKRREGRLEISDLVEDECEEDDGGHDQAGREADWPTNPSEKSKIEDTFPRSFADEGQDEEGVKEYDT